MCTDADGVSAGAIAGDEENKAEGRAKLRKAHRAKKRASGQRPNRPRRKPKELRGSETGSGARRRADGRRRRGHSNG